MSKLGLNSHAESFLKCDGGVGNAERPHQRVLFGTVQQLFFIRARSFPQASSNHNINTTIVSMSVSSAADGDDDNDAAVLTERLYGILKNGWYMMNDTCVINQILINQSCHLARITSAETVFTTAALAYERLGLTAAEVDRIKRHYAASTFPGFVTGNTHRKLNGNSSFVVYVSLN